MRLSGRQTEEACLQQARHATGQLKKYEEEEHHIPSKRIKFSQHTLSPLLCLDR